MSDTKWARLFYWSPWPLIPGAKRYLAEREAIEKLQHAIEYLHESGRALDREPIEIIQRAKERIVFS